MARPMTCPAAADAAFLPTPMSAGPPSSALPGAPSVRLLLALAMPMVLARATQSVISFADAYQVKHLGPDALVATATGGLNVFGLVILPMGLVFIVQSFVAQLVGKGDRDATPRFAWYGLVVAAVAGVVALAALPLIEPLLGLTDFTPPVQEMMGGYMAIRLTSVAAIVGMEALGNWYGGLGNTYMQMVAGIIAMVVNVFLNWVLIGGHLGAPTMGVEGAALASSLASWAGFAFLAIAFWRRWGGAPRGARPLGRRPDRDGRSTEAANLEGSQPLTWREFRRVVRFGLPNGLNWFLEFGAFQMFINVVFADLGTASTAAFNAVIAINSLSFMPAFGLASAGAILAAQSIGRGARDQVWPQLRITLVCTLGWMGAIGLVYLVVPAQLLGLFAQESEAGAAMVAVGTGMLALSAAWQLFDAVAMTFAETLRSAGDTRWTMAARLVLAWALFFPASYLVVVVGGAGPLAAMGCLVGYLVVLAIAFVLRFRSGAWKHIELIEPTLV